MILLWESILPAGIGGDYINTQLEIIQSPAVALKVVRDLKMAEDPQAEKYWVEDTGGHGSIENWLAEGLLKRLTAEAGKQNSIITLTYTARDPQQAATIANAFAQAYVHTNLELRVAPAKEASQWFSVAGRRPEGQPGEGANEAIGIPAVKGDRRVPDDRFDVENTSVGGVERATRSRAVSSHRRRSRKRQLDQYTKEGRNPEALPGRHGNAAD